MLNREELLLASLAEEASEVVKEVMKILRFGLDDTHPIDGNTNRKRLAYELTDLLAVLALLTREIELPLLGDDDLIDAKQARVEQYIKYSLTKETE